MAINRGPIRYGITVDGAVRAADEIGKVDKAAAGAGQSLRGSGKAALEAGRDYASAEAEARSLGARFDDVNERAAQFGGRFGDVRSRLGEVEDALLVLSGVAFVQLGQALYEGIKTVYSWTEAGKEAEREAEALAAAFDDIKNSLDRLTGTGVIEALDPATYARLGAAIATTKEEEAEYTEAIQKTVEAQLRVNKARADYERVKADPNSAAFGEGIHQEAKELGIYERALEGARDEVEKLRVSLGEKRAAEQQVREEAEKARREQENQIRAAKTLTDSIVAQARALPDAIAGWGDYHMAVARGRDGAPGVFESVVDWHARMANAVVSTADAVGKSIDKHNAAAEAARRQAEAQARLNAERERAFRIEQQLAEMDLEYEGAEAEARAPADVDAEGRGSIFAGFSAVMSVADAAFQAVGAGLDELWDDFAERGRELERDRAWQAWAGAATEAIGSVQSALGAVSTMLGAIAEFELTPLRNTATRAEETLALAEAAERAAEAEARRAKNTAGAAAADARLAASSRERAAAEQAVYESRLALVEAEEKSAETMKALRVLEFTLEGAKMVAKTLEASATASLLFAAQQYPQAVAATAAAVTYGLAAAAYGVAAGVTAATPTARQQRLTAPTSEARDTIGAGDRERGREGTTNNYFSFGSVLGTTTEAEDAVVHAWNNAQKRRGGARADYDRSYRRS